MIRKHKGVCAQYYICATLIFMPMIERIYERGARCKVVL